MMWQSQGSKKALLISIDVMQTAVHDNNNYYVTSTADLPTIRRSTSTVTVTVTGCNPDELWRKSFIRFITDDITSQRLSVPSSIPTNADRCAQRSEKDSP
eukprot:scpid111074/ scgid30418/ 